ncbi:MAG TPA: cupin domain-containing protein [Ktedonobacteraceae bacterium]|nr:cupin domain-containing protein [Ktedonobacteraceae bacterium]
MTEETRKSHQPEPLPGAAEQPAENDANSFPRRSLLKGATVAAATLGALGGIALPAGAASAATSTAMTPLAKRSASGKKPDSFKFSLEKSAPDVFVGGTNRTAVAGDIEELSGMSLFSLRINPGAMRELHWHINANELNYCLSGQGEIGIFLSGTSNTVFPISPGSVSFVPMGAIHYIRNTGPDTLHMIVTFNHESPEHIDLSNSLNVIPRSILAQTYSIPTASFPALPQQGDQFLVNTGAIPTATPSSSSGPFTASFNDIPAKPFGGGTVAALTPQFIPSLDGITLFIVNEQPGGLREPHWHPNAAEINYCVQGQGQFEIITPDNTHEIFGIQPGDVVFAPQNYLHHVGSTTNEPLTLLIFFSNSVVGHVDLSQMTTFFERGLFSASFGLDPHAFDNIPNLGDVTVAPKNPNP